MQPPDFWEQGGAAAVLLSPAGRLFQAAGRLRSLFVTPWQAPIPVLCVGNLTVGGAGKTPVALDIAQRLHQAGRAPHMLTRGYGGKLRGPLRVDPSIHCHEQVGDEALLLAGIAPTWLSPDRAAGARAAVAAGAGAIVMDDGFQNPGLVKDLSVLVVDGGYGFGNGRVMPAGPLRETPEAGLARAGAVALIGADRQAVADRVDPALPLLRARLVVEPAAAESLRTARVVAFAGIGRPEKFFDTLSDLGCELSATYKFADHHSFDPGELDALIEAADKCQARLVTTTKDHVRLPPPLRRKVLPVPVTVLWDEPNMLDSLLNDLFSHGQT